MSTVLVFRILDHDAALARPRVEPHLGAGAEQRPDKRVVHRAHQHRELFGQRAEREFRDLITPPSRYGR